jgi:hypothetical protein
MSRAFSLVFGQLVIGGFLTLVFVPPGILGRGFYRFMGGFYAVLLGFAWWVEGQVFGFAGSIALWSGLFAAVVLLYAVLVWTPLRAVGYGLVWLAIPCGIGALWQMATGIQSAYGGLSATAWGLWGSFLLSSLLLGSAMTAMLFGHWYLTTPDLPTRYLRRLNNTMLVALVGMGLWLAVTIWLARAWLSETGFLALGSFGGIFLWTRLLVGIGVSLTCGLFTWFCLREDSTQAATGFLYLVVVFLLMGELLGRFLLEKTLLPL